MIGAAEVPNPYILIPIRANRVVLPLRDMWARGGRTPRGGRCAPRGRGRGRSTGHGGRAGSNIRSRLAEIGTGPGSVSAVLRVLADTLSSGGALDPSSCCAAIHKLGKAAGASEEEATLAAAVDCRPLAELIASLTEHAIVGAIRSRDLTKVYYGLARLRWPADDRGVLDLLEALGTQCTAIAHDLDPMGVASVLWALSKLPVASLKEAQFNVLQRTAVSLVSSFNPQDVAQTLHAIGRLCDFDRSAGADNDSTTTEHFLADRSLVAALVSRANDVCDRLKPEELSSAIGAAAVLAVPIKEYSPLLDRTIHIVEQFKPSSLSSVAHSLARCNVLCSGVFQGIGDIAAQLLQSGVKVLGEQECANIAWAFAKNREPHPRFFKTLCIAVAKEASMFTEQGLSNVAWALVTLQSLEVHGDEVVGDAIDAIRMVVTVSAHQNNFTLQNLCSLWHSIAVAGKCDKTCSTSMANAVSERLRRTAGSPQDISAVLAAICKDERTHPDILRLVEHQTKDIAVDAANVHTLASILWGFARCGHRPNFSVLSPLTREIGSRARTCAAREICNTMWSLAVLDMKDTPIFGDLVHELPRICEDMNDQDVSNTVYALAKFDYAADKPLRKLCGAAVVRHSAQMTAGSLALAVWGLSKLHLNSGSTRNILDDAVLANLADMHAQNVGLLCHAAACGRVLTGEKMGKPLLKRAKETLGDMNWQSVGHVHLLMEAQPQFASKFRSFLGRLARRATELVQAVRTTCKQHFDRVAECGAACAIDIQKNVARGSRIVLFGRDTGKVRQCLKKLDFKVHRYERFSSGSRLGRDWPKASSASAVVLSLPATVEWLELDLVAAATILSAESRVYCYGHKDDLSMLQRCRTLNPARYFTFQETQYPDSMTFWTVLIRNGTTVPPSQNTIEGWTKESQLTVFDRRSVPWITAPGLFAGGGMDVMTSFLLEHIPSISSTANVLDFCSGSGTIAKAILVKYPKATATLLDADALALRVAKRNLPGLNFVLSDGWNMLPTGACFDVIISNPPVHRGRCQDFSVLEDLILGAAVHLKPAGVVIFVTQSYVPAGLIALQSGATVDLIAYDGRFSVWQMTSSSEDSSMKPSIERKRRATHDPDVSDIDDSKRVRA